MTLLYLSNEVLERILDYCVQPESTEPSESLQTLHALACTCKQLYVFLFGQNHYFYNRLTSRHRELLLQDRIPVSRSRCKSRALEDLQTCFQQISRQQQFTLAFPTLLPVNQTLYRIITIDDTGSPVKPYCTSLRWSVEDFVYIAYNHSLYLRHQEVMHDFFFASIPKQKAYCASGRLLFVGPEGEVYAAFHPDAQKMFLIYLPSSIPLTCSHIKSLLNWYHITLGDGVYFAVCHKMTWYSHSITIVKCDRFAKVLQYKPGIEKRYRRKYLKAKVDQLGVIGKTLNQHKLSASNLMRLNQMLDRLQDMVSKMPLIKRLKV